MRPKNAKHLVRKKGEKNCIWCGIAVKRGGNGPTSATREHLIPLSHGGGGGANIHVACARCNNRRRSDVTWVEWRKVPEWLRHKGVAYKLVDGHFEQVAPLMLRAR